MRYTNMSEAILAPRPRAARHAGLLAAMLAISLAVTGCFSDSAPNPRQVSQSFLQAVQNTDETGANAWLTPAALRARGMFVSDSTYGIVRYPAYSYGAVIGFSILSVTTTNNQSIVKTHVIYAGTTQRETEDFTFTLKQQSGNWRIDSIVATS